MNLYKTVKKYRELFKSKPAATTAHTDKGHFYVSPNSQEKYHSVTYFTSFIKDPSLSNWRMNRAINYIASQWQDLGTYSELEIDKILADAKQVPEGDFQLAGDIGSRTHSWREEWFSKWIESGEMNLSDSFIDAYPLPQNVDVEVISGCRAIKKFLKETGYIPVACELALVDDDLKVGGTIDDLGVFPHSYCVPLSMAGPERWEDRNGSYRSKNSPYLGFVDLKTSNQGKKPAYAFQVRGFYQRMIRKTFNIKPKKTYILHTSKLNGDYSLIDLTEMKFLEKDCEDLVRLSRSWDSVTQAFKPKVITI